MAQEIWDRQIIGRPFEKDPDVWLIAVIFKIISAAKMGLVSFTKTLAREGVKYNIKVSVIAPIAASPMTETIMPPELLAGIKARDLSQVLCGKTPFITSCSQSLLRLLLES